MLSPVCSDTSVKTLFDLIPAGNNTGIFSDAFDSLVLVFCPPGSVFFSYALLRFALLSLSILFWPNFGPDSFFGFPALLGLWATCVYSLDFS